MNRLLVDGYNLAHKMGVKVSASNLVLVREQVERVLLSYAASRKIRITVVYDGKGSLGSYGSMGALEMEFTPEGQTADARIKALIDESPSKARLMVVSSDLSIRQYARISGVKNITSEAFLKEVSEMVHMNPSQQKQPKAKNFRRQEKPGTLSQKELDEWIRIFGE
ncbi:MAG: hypothetical protein HGB11_04525 [Chlorobiales bacterium]|nr:hypothetical protein [Chlorobiales bacterium]